MSQEFSATIQAFTGIGTLIVAIIVLIQSVKVKNLTHVTTELEGVVKELATQNTTLLKGHLLQQKLSMHQLQPFFTIQHIRDSIHRIEIILENIGVNAHKFRVVQDSLPNLVLSAEESIHAGMKLTVYIDWPETVIFSEPIIKTGRAKFTFSDSYGNNFEQIISVTANVPTLSQPLLIS